MQFYQNLIVQSKPKYLPADEYLSGNVREKLRWAKRSAELYPEDYGENVRALEAVQPVDLTASEISVRLGATWLPPETIEEFMFELFSTPRYCQWNIHVHYAQYTGEWNVEGKSYDRTNVKAYNTYGTNRINGYKIGQYRGFDMELSFDTIMPFSAIGTQQENAIKNGYRQDCPKKVISAGQNRSLFVFAANLRFLGLPEN